MTINGYGLFRDFTTQEAEQMKEWATNVVLHGKVAHPDPEWDELPIRRFVRVLRGCPA